MTPIPGYFYSFPGVFQGFSRYFPSVSGCFIDRQTSVTVSFASRSGDSVSPLFYLLIFVWELKLHVEVALFPYHLKTSKVCFGYAM
jgi:hypothetical protein